MVFQAHSVGTMIHLWSQLQTRSRPPHCDNDQMSHSSIEYIRLLAVVQNLGHSLKTKEPITEIVMNHAVNQTISDAHIVCQFIDTYPPFLSNLFMYLNNCVWDDCTVALIQS